MTLYMQRQSSYKVHLNTISNGELSDPLCHSVNRGLTLVRLNFLDSVIRKNISSLAVHAQYWTCSPPPPPPKKKTQQKSKTHLSSYLVAGKLAFWYKNVLYSTVHLSHKSIQRHVSSHQRLKQESNRVKKTIPG